jgi:hypothetical protein
MATSESLEDTMHEIHYSKLDSHMHEIHYSKLDSFCRLRIFRRLVRKPTEVKQFLSVRASR